MSRVGKNPVVIPQGVNVNIDSQVVTVDGPKGTLSQVIDPVVNLELVEGESGKEVRVTVDNEKDKNERSQWGTARALIANMVTGVTEGYSKQLEVNGVGYRVNLEGRILTLIVGYSHDVPFPLPDGIDALVEGNKITISGASKQLVGEIADNIRKIRKPEPYKGKGIKYMDEVIRRKAGKSQKAGE